MTQTMPNKLALKIPKILAAIPAIRHLPWPGPLGYVPKFLQRFLVEKVSNRLLQTQIEQGDFDFMETLSLRLRINDLGYDWQVTKDGERLIFSDGNDSAETTFSGNSQDFLLLASRREDPDTLFFQRRLSIEGNTEMGLRVKNLVDSIDQDDFPVALNHALYLSADFVEALATN